MYTLFFKRIQNAITCRLVVRGFRKTLETSDLWLLRKEETTDFNRSVFAPQWEPVMRQWREQQAELEAAAKQKDASRPSGNGAGALNVNGRTEDTAAAAGAVTNMSSNPRVDALERAPAANMKRSPSIKKSGNGTGAPADAIEMKTIGYKQVEQEEAATEKTEEKENKPKPPLIKMLLKVYGPMLLLSQCIVAIYVVTYFCNPLLLWYDLILSLRVQNVYCTRL